MKKYLLIFMAAFTVMSSAAQGFGRKDVLIPFEQIHTDAAIKQYKKATKMNQMEIINEFLRQANAKYKACKTIDEVRDLRENVMIISRYIKSGKQSFMSAQKDYNILYNKINKTIKEYEGGTTLYHEKEGFDDFGQELD